MQIKETSRGAVTFTFDDFPISAATEGARILEENGARGTFFVSGSLENKITSSGANFSPDILIRLIENGHEIGSHTFSHIRPFSQNEHDFIHDLIRNQHYLKEFSISDPLSFSYPFGECTAALKRHAANQFTFCRGIVPGLNFRQFDRAYLRSNKIYSHLFNKGQLLRMIEQAARNKAWIIFYTHDIQENCSPFGCSPDQFDWVVKACLQHNLEIRNFREMENFTLSPE